MVEFGFHSKWGRKPLKDSNQGSDGIWLLWKTQCKECRERDQWETIIVVQVADANGLDWGYTKGDGENRVRGKSMGWVHVLEVEWRELLQYIVSLVSLVFLGFFFLTGNQDYNGLLFSPTLLRPQRIVINCLTLLGQRAKMYIIQ